MCIKGGNACERVEGKSLRFCGTSLDVENFSKGLMCLSTSSHIKKPCVMYNELQKNASIYVLLH